jgi:predicted MFS family arabinose efflux permease
MLLAGGLITPQTTGHSLVVEVVAPRGQATEAFGWVVTAITVGGAIGQSVAGQLVQASGPAAAFVVGGTSGLALAVILWCRRRSVEGSAA